MNLRRIEIPAWVVAVLAGRPVPADKAGDELLFHGTVALNERFSFDLFAYQGEEVWLDAVVYGRDEQGNYVVALAEPPGTGLPPDNQYQIDNLRGCPDTLVTIEVR